MHASHNSTLPPHSQKRAFGSQRPGGFVDETNIAGVVIVVVVDFGNVGAVLRDCAEKKKEDGGGGGIGGGRRQRSRTRQLKTTGDANDDAGAAVAVGEGSSDGESSDQGSLHPPRIKKMRPSILLYRKIL